MLVSPSLMRGLVATNHDVQLRWWPAEHGRNLYFEGRHCCGFRDFNLQMRNCCTPLAKIRIQ